MTGFLSHEEVEALAAHALDAALRGGASGAGAGADPAGAAGKASHAEVRHETGADAAG